MARVVHRAVVPGVHWLGMACLAAALLLPDVGHARRAQEGQAAGAPGTVSLASLPPAAVACRRRIDRGGPFPYAKDGVVFANRERSLPAEPRGYYREYTVPTPGARDRGARRIVCGGRMATQPVACYYTDNHYRSFRRIVE